MTKIYIALIAATLVISALVPASAAYTIWQDKYYGVGDVFVPTNWGLSPAVFLTFDKFDTTGGLVLTKLEWSFDGAVQGDVLIENTSVSSTNTITWNLQATEKFMLPDLTVLTTLVPLSSGSTLEPIFDGTLDFLGASGDTFSGLSAVAGPSTGSIGPGPNLDLFKSAGPSTIGLPVSAKGDSTASDTSGDFASQFKTEAKVHGRIRYEYNTGEIPEPGTASLMLAGLAAVGLLRRRRSA